MTDEELELLKKQRPLAFPGRGVPLTQWKKGDTYKYIFAVTIKNTDPENLTCTVLCLHKDITIDLSDISKTHYEEVLKYGVGMFSNGLDLPLKSVDPSILIFYLNEDKASFVHELYPASDVSHVIERDPNEAELIYEATWLKDVPQGRAFSVVMDGRQTGKFKIPYGLRVCMLSDGAISFINIDPKIHNDGEP